MAIIKKKKIKIPVYNSTLWVYLADSLCDVDKELKTNFTGLDTAWAIAFQNNSNPNILYTAFTPDYANKSIAHEAVHLVNYLFKRKGIELDLDNDENQAYWTGWFYDEIEKVLKS